MATRTPSPLTAELDDRYGEPEAPATTWPQAAAVLEAAELSWLSTVRADGRPHVTPLITVFDGGAAYFTTGVAEQKARNLAANPQCTLTTGRNDLHGGLDVVLEGRARIVRDEGRLRELAAAWLAKYGEEWHFEVRDGAFHHEGGPADVYEVAPVTAYAFGKGPYSHTRFTFAS